MTIEHKDIVDPNIHEPKGINTAASNTFYRANGVGAGTWAKVPTQGLAGISGNGSVNQSLVVDGAGNQKILNGTAHGSIYFLNIASPSVVTYPSLYAKINPTTIANGGAIEFTENTTASLVYTGTENRFATVNASASVAQSSGADRDIRIAIYKNGVIVSSSESILTATTTHKRRIATFTDIPLVTGDVIEAYIKNDGASGDISVFTFKLECRAFLT